MAEVPCTLAAYLHASGMLSGGQRIDGRESDLVGAQDLHDDCTMVQRAEIEREFCCSR